MMKTKLTLLTTLGAMASGALLAAVSLMDDFENRAIGDPLIGSTTSDGNWTWGMAGSSANSPQIAETDGLKFVDLGGMGQSSMTWESTGSGAYLNADPANPLEIEFDYLYLTPWGDNNFFRIIYLLDERWTNMDAGSATDPTGYALRVRVVDDSTFEYNIRQKGGGTWSTVEGTQGTFAASGLLNPDAETPGNAVRVRLRVEGNRQRLWVNGEEQFDVDIDPHWQNANFDNGYVQFWSNDSRRRGLANLAITEIVPGTDPGPQPGEVDWVVRDDFENRFLGQEVIGSTTSDLLWNWTYHSAGSPVIAEHENRLFADFNSQNQLSMSFQSVSDNAYLELDPDETIAIEFDYLYLTPWNDNNFFNTHYLLQDRWTNLGGASDPTGYSLRLQVTSDTTLDYAIRQRAGGSYTSVEGSVGTFETSGLLNSDAGTPGRPVRIRLEIKGNHQSLWIEGEHQFTLDIDPLPQNENFSTCFVQFWSNSSRRRGIDNIGIGYVTDGVVPDTGFAAWLAEHFSPLELNNPAISGEAASPAGDGISNVLKYALDLDPWTPSRDGLPKVVREDGELRITHRSRNDDPDLAYVVEVSGDLVTWHHGEEHVETLATWMDGDVEIREARALAIPGGGSTGFMRLRVIKD